MKKAKALVVDDDDNNRFICEVNLKQLGFAVLLAEDGQEGLDLAIKELPDVILLDIMMPKMNGYQVLDALRKNPGTSDIPVIILTAKTDAMAKEIEKALLAGANDYVRKPYQLAELTARVRTLTERRLAEKAKIALEKERAVDLQDAARVQRKFLTNKEAPGDMFNNAGLNVVFFNQPATDVSGDFWFHKKMPKGKAGLFVADTCGHGVLAALMSMRILSVIDHCPAPALRPSEFLININSDIYGMLSPESSFVAGMYFIFESRKVIFSNAGQPAPFLLHDGGVIELKNFGPPLGIFPDLKAKETEHDFTKGDRLVIYTDGLFEEMNAQGEPFGTERVAEFLQKNQSLPIEDLKDSLISEVRGFVSGRFDDDVTVIVIERE
ncbi:MAG: SpoIIE family protein phosphatase [Candidatus Magnetobacterium sp. LHC-1]|nr:SpoIIE family protein phosphatase [Nitrospirota bacterium]